ncbi:MAG: pyridoxal phosphate-dependent aminotransferase [Bacteriovoracaceae bacterium]|nr:pyridoxal phosphate-dependent aminotransferase [Bacteriovoracaceae bacterium]
MNLHPLPHRKFINNLRSIANITDNLSNACAPATSVSDWVSEEKILEIARLPSTYVSDLGSWELRKTIADLYIRRPSHPIDPEDVIVFTGAQEAIFALQISLLGPHDEVLVVTPTYGSMMSFLLSLKIKIIEVPLSQENSWKINVSKIEQSLTPRTKLISINFPNNPIGVDLTPEDKGELAKLSEKYNIPILSDEVGLWTKSQTDLGNWKGDALSSYSDKVISLGVTSKSFGLPGIRLGWLIVRDQGIREKILSVKTHLSICSSQIDDFLAVEIFKRADEILVHHNQMIEENKTKFALFCKKHSHLFRYQKVDTGVTGIVEFVSSLDVKEFSHSLAMKNQLLMIPSEFFYLPGNFFRIGFGAKNFSEMLEKLEDFILKTS